MPKNERCCPHIRQLPYSGKDGEYPQRKNSPVGLHILTGHQTKYQKTNSNNYQNQSYNQHNHMLGDNIPANQRIISEVKRERFIGACGIQRDDFQMHLLPGILLGNKAGRPVRVSGMPPQIIFIRFQWGHQFSVNIVISILMNGIKSIGSSVIRNILNLPLINIFHSRRCWRVLHFFKMIIFQHGKRPVITAFAYLIVLTYANVSGH